MKHEDRLYLFSLSQNLSVSEVLAHLFGMSQGQAHFLIYQLSRICAKRWKEWIIFQRELRRNDPKTG
ncbi:MAG: hypothetical protein IPL99_11515 [Candidatus Competibacteraceae bacterium]|nr:hypothetical protein [Candidatus Competibacteraceae bacterium]